MSNRIRLWAVTVTAVAAGALAGCGEDDDSGKVGQKVTVPGVSADVNQRLNALYRKGVKAKTTKVTLYGPGTSNNQVLFDAFEDRFPGIDVKPVDQADSVSATKIAAEQSSGRQVADFYAGGTAPSLTLSKKGSCEKIDVFTTKLPKDREKAPGVTTYYYTPFGFVYNTDKVKESEVPKSWEDLLDPRWKGQMEIFDPTTVGGPRFMLAQMQLPPASERYGVPYLQKLATQDLTFAPAEPTVPTDIASGRKSLGIAVWRGFYNGIKAKGGPVGFSFPLEDANFLVDSSMCHIKGGPAGPVSTLFFNWLFTSEAQKVIAEKLGGYSAAPGAVAPPGAPARDELNILPQIKGGDVDAYQKYFAQVDAAFKK